MARDRSGLDVRYYLDPETGEPHIYEHDVTEAEVRDVLRKPIEEIRGRSGSLVAHGRTRSGRYLKVVYVRDDDGNGLFVVTAFDLPERQVRALRRRSRGNDQ